MWARTADADTWHYYAGSESRFACGTEDSRDSTAEQAERPVGFETRVCYRCWFQEEWRRARESCSNASDRTWLRSADFPELDQMDPDRLSNALGSDSAERLRVLCAASSSMEGGIILPQAPESPRARPEAASEGPTLLTSAPPSPSRAAIRPKPYLRIPLRRAIRSGQPSADSLFLLFIGILALGIPLAVVLLMSGR